MQASSKGSDQTARMGRLIWGFAGPTYHIVGNLMSRLICNQYEKKHWLVTLFILMGYIENTGRVSFDIKFTRQGFKNACWHCEACLAIQHEFSKLSLVNLISKDMNLVFYLLVCPLFHSSNKRLWRNFRFFVDSVSLATSLKKCNVIMTW